MKNYIIFALMFSCTIYISLLAQDKYDTERKYYYTIVNVQRPLIKIINEPLFAALDSVVLRRKFHSKGLFKNNIYDVSIRKDTVDKGYFIYVALLDSSRLNYPDVAGVSEKKGALFNIRRGEDFDVFFSLTNNYKTFTVKKYYCKKENHIIDNCQKPTIKEYPAWLFYYNERNIRLIFGQFLPDEGQDHIFLDHCN